MYPIKLSYSFIDRRKPKIKSLDFSTMIGFLPNRLSPHDRSPFFVTPAWRTFMAGTGSIRVGLGTSAWLFRSKRRAVQTLHTSSPTGLPPRREPSQNYSKSYFGLQDFMHI